MVLILSTEKPGEGRKSEKEFVYSFTVPTNNVVLFYDSSADTIPGQEAIEEQLRLYETPNKPTFFVTPFEGLTEGEDRSDVLSVVMSNISHCVNHRENVTLINRGAECDQYLEQILLSLLNSIKNSAEYAMQVVADEVAKEKQMQRLLQLEDNDNAELQKIAKESRAEESNSGAKTLPLSKKLRNEIKTLSKEYAYDPSASQSNKGKSLKNRYTVLSSLHGEDLKPPSNVANMNQSTFVDATASQKKSVTLPNNEKNTRSSSFLFDRKKRKSTLSLLANLDTSATDGEQLALVNNGWGESVRLFSFNGESSFMSLPGVPRFEDLVRSFAVDFWIRTDCKSNEGKRVIFQILEGQREDLGQLFQLSLNCYPEMEESFRIMCRDSTNRVLEAIVPLSGRGVTDGKEFHHVKINIISMDEGQIECYVDGRMIVVQLLQQEHPIAFNPWPHRLFIGGFLDENNSPTCVFRGTLMALRFWSLGEVPKPVLIWPLLVRDGKLVEVTKTIPEDHHETLQNLQRIEESAPCASPYFDGNLVVNMGNLSLWGDLMHNWRVEIRFRTDVTNKMMSIFGVTDQKYKMQEIGIVLNAEPVFSKERVHYHELNTTFYIVDAFGACCSALLRGNDRQCLMDGEWHTIVWRCIDSESNKFSVKVDGVYQDLLYISRDGPRRFDSFENWVCLGGHNVRNWKTKNTFIGQICRFFVSIRGYRYVTLHMNEGPGAYVLEDKSGHRNHGLLINAETNVVCKNNTIWMPADEPKEEGEEVVKMDVVIYKNNNVSIAAVVFGCAFDDKGVCSEVLHDVFSGNNFDLDVIENHVSDQRAEWKTWRAIPNSCYKPLQSVTQLEDSINEVLSASIPRGHLMVVVRVGDCFVTLLHLRNAELPKGSTYNCNMLKWHYPYMVEGTHGRRELMLNRMIEAMEGVLACDTFTPFTTARLGPLNSGGNSVVSEDIIRTLQNSGKPWFLASVLHHNLLNSEYGSHLHIVHRIFPKMTYDEAASVALFNKKLHDGSKEKASLIIQRNWRGKMAKLEASKRDNERRIRDRKIEEVHTFRMNPTVQAKQRLYALIIILSHPKTEAVPSFEVSVDELQDALQKQGYEVECLRDITLPNVMKAISLVDTDRSSFIFIIGYGGLIRLKQPPIFPLQSLHQTLQEGAARAALESERGAEYRSLLQTFRSQLKEMKPAKKKKASKAPPPAKKKKPEEIEAEQRQLENEMRTAQASVEQAETFSRDSILKEWENEVQLINKTMRQAIVATSDFESSYKSSEDDANARAFIYPCESGRVEPYANHVLDVDEVMRAALHRQAPPIGLQSVIAFDLAPITPYSRGLTCMASSTGNTLRVTYKPEQRLIATNVITKIFDGHLPQVSASAKYAVLSGGIETEANQRDWKSCASYYVNKLRECCSTEEYNELRKELDRELPFTSELIPVRDIVLTGEAKDRLKRDREAQKVSVELLFGVGSLKVQSDMFSVFRNFLEDLPLAEITFINEINIIFSKHNKGIDGLVMASLENEIERLRPERCAVPVTIKITSQGAKVIFESGDSSDKLLITQWLNSIVVRSITWQIDVNPLEGYSKLDVEYVEYIYRVKTTCSLQRFIRLQKQQHKKPVPANSIRFLQCQVAAQKK